LGKTRGSKKRGKRQYQLKQKTARENLVERGGGGGGGGGGVGGGETPVRMKNVSGRTHKKETSTYTACPKLFNQLESERRQEGTAMGEFGTHQRYS